MSGKRKPSKKNRGSINLSILLIIIALLAILSYALSFLFINDASDDQQLITTKPNNLAKEEIKSEDVKILTPINGSWYSTYDGSILTIDGTTFKQETPSVDNSKIITGTIEVIGNEVVFKYNGNSKTCAEIPGKYRWKIEDKKKLIFILVSDGCKARSERMSAPWESL